MSHGKQKASYDPWNRGLKLIANVLLQGDDQINRRTLGFDRRVPRDRASLGGTLGHDQTVLGVQTKVEYTFEPHEGTSFLAGYMHTLGSTISEESHNLERGDLIEGTDGL